MHIFHGVRTYSKRYGCTKNIRWSIFAISATISIRKTVRYYGIQNISSHIVRTELGVDDEYFTVISCVPNSILNRGAPKTKTSKIPFPRLPYFPLGLYMRWQRAQQLTTMAGKAVHFLLQVAGVVAGESRVSHLFRLANIVETITLRNTQ